MLQLSANQSVKMQVPQKEIPLRHYLRQPRRLVHALMNPHQVEDLGGDRFRLKLRTVQFFMLSIKPVVDLHIDASRERYLAVRSVACQIQGNEFINQRFHLNLTGILEMDTQAQLTHLEGHVKLAIAVDLPPVLQLTPRSLLEVTGNSILQGVLATMKQRLMHQLAADYELWNAQQATATTAKLAVNSTSPQAACLDS